MEHWIRRWHLPFGSELMAIVVLAAGSTDPIAALERKQQALFEKIAPSVVFISDKRAFGSGFYVQPNLVLTNAHVVEGANRVNVVLHDGRRVVGNVVERASDKIDLALVEVPEAGKPLTLATRSELRVGTWVASVGHGMGGIWTFTTGMISNIYPAGHERPVFQTQIPLNPGASGGPVFDSAGNVLGIVTAGIEDSNAINFAIRSDVATLKLERLATNCDCLVVLAPKGANVFVDGKMRGTGPRVVLQAEKRTYQVFTVIDGKMKEMKATYPATKTVDLR